MGRRKIEGTHHIRRKWRLKTKIAMIAAALVFTAVLVFMLFIKGDNNKKGLPNLKNIVETVKDKLTSDDEFILRGQEMITVNTYMPNNGTVKGEGGTLDKSSNYVEVENSENYRTFSVNADEGYKLSKWEVYNSNNEVIDEISGETIRVYYYDDNEKVSRTGNDGVTEYITGESIYLNPVFVMDDGPDDGADDENSDRARHITVITSPNVGEVDFWIYSDPGKYGWEKRGRTGYLYNFFSNDTRTVGVCVSDVNGAEKTQFYGEDPRYDIYLYHEGSLMQKWLDKQPGKIKDTTGYIEAGKNWDPGRYTFVLVPHLKTGYLDQVAVQVEPDSSWGSATWNGSQVIATPSEGYMFDHWEWYSQNKLNTSKEKVVAAKPSGAMLYTAFFKKAQYKIDIAGMTPPNAAKISGTGTFAKGTDVKITVEPKSGYKFKDATWTTENGIYHHADATTDSKGITTFTVPNLSEDIFITFDFDTDKFTIETRANPSTLGTVSVENKTNPTAPGPLVKEDFFAGDKAVLTASPNSDNMFLYWEDSNSNRYYDKELVIDEVYLSETFTAHFSPSSINFTLNFNPGGSAKVYYVNKDGKNSEITLPTSDGTSFIAIKPNTNVMINAEDTFTDGSGNLLNFANFVKEGDSNRYNDNPLSISDVIKDTVVNVNYVENVAHIKASVESLDATADGCTVSILVGGEDKGDTVTVTHGQEITLKATAADNWEFLYFKDKANKKITNLTFKVLNGDEEFKAVFVKKAINVTTVTNTAEGDVSIKYTDTSGKTVEATGANTYEIKGGSAVTLTGVPKAGYYIKEFTDDLGNTYPVALGDDTVVIANVIQDTTFTAIFEKNKYKISYNISPSIGGSVTIYDADASAELTGNPAYVSDGHKIKLTATPSAGYKFLYFKEQDGTKIININADKTAPFTTEEFNPSGDKSYIAYFAKGTTPLTISISPDPASGYVETQYTSSTTGKSATVKSLQIDDVDGSKGVTLTARPSVGYEFDKFINIDTGSEVTANPYTIGTLLDATNIEAVFKPLTCSIGVTVEPSATAGSATVNGMPGIATGIKYGETVTILATPANNYSFKYFEDKNGNKYSGNDEGDGKRSLIFKAVNGDETYKAVFGMSQITVNIAVDPSAKDKDGVSFLAGGYKITYTDTSGNTQTRELYTSGTFADVKGIENVEITAIPKAGFRFSKFTDTDGGNYTENPLIFSKLPENKDVTIYFVPDEAVISAVASPEIGGSVTVNGRLGSQRVQYGKPVEILATASPGFIFKYFKDSKGNEFSSNPLKFTAVNGDEVYTAVFGMSQITINVNVNPTEKDADGVDFLAGGYKITYTDTSGKIQSKELYTSETFTDVKGLENVEITAIAKDGYKFSKFTDTDGGNFTENPLIFSELSENKDVTIHFVSDEAVINVVTSPEMGGTATINGRTGSQRVQAGKPVEILATANEGYTFKYYKDSNGNEYSSNPLKFNAINGNETFTAYFVKNEITVTIDLTPAGSGTVRFNDEVAVSTRTTYTTDGRSNIRLSATAKEGREFVYWKDQDGNTYQDNPITIVDVSKDLVFTAVFDGEILGIRAVASPASGGKIRKIINDDGSITLIAVANKGYTFISWKKGSVLLTKGTKYTIPAASVKDGDVYTAYFSYNKNYDAKSDITKEKFYREWRKVVTPNYTVTRDSMKLLAIQTVGGLRQYDDATPELRNYSAVANAEAYFDERVAKDIARLDGIFGDAELVTAEGEILTVDKLPDQLTYEQIAKKFTDKKFGDRYETEILTVKKIIQPKGFNNINRTYLWRYTGAEYKDNIYLIYNVDEDTQDIVTPIVDEDGVIKFTIDNLKDNDIAAVVRVKIK